MHEKTSRTCVSQGPAPLFVVALVASSSFWVGGCGLNVKQRTALEKFSTATTDMADLAARELVKIRQDVIALRQQMAVIDPQAIDLDDEANDLDGSLTQEQVLDRLHGVIAMKKFGELLHVLATANQTPQIRTATDSFLTNLREFDDVELTETKTKPLLTNARGLRCTAALSPRRQPPP